MDNFFSLRMKQMIQVMVRHSGAITSHNRAGMKKITLDNFRRNGWRGGNI